MCSPPLALRPRDLLQGRQQQQHQQEQELQSCCVAGTGCRASSLDHSTRGPAQTPNTCTSTAGGLSCLLSWRAWPLGCFAWHTGGTWRRLQPRRQQGRAQRAQTGRVLLFSRGCQGLQRLAATGQHGARLDLPLLLQRQGRAGSALRGLSTRPSCCSLTAQQQMSWWMGRPTKRRCLWQRRQWRSSCWPACCTGCGAAPMPLGSKGAGWTHLPWLLLLPLLLGQRLVQHLVLEHQGSRGWARLGTLTRIRNSPDLSPGSSRTPLPISSTSSKRNRGYCTVLTRHTDTLTSSSCSINSLPTSSKAVAHRGARVTRWA